MNRCDGGRFLDFASQRHPSVRQLHGPMERLPARGRVGGALLRPAYPALPPTAVDRDTRKRVSFYLPRE